MTVIAIARQYGSLGDEIGQDLSEALHLRLVDNAVLVQVAAGLGLSAGPENDYDERRRTLVGDLIRTMQRLYPATFAPPTAVAAAEPDDEANIETVRRVISEVAGGQGAVIVGRGSVHILADRADVLHVLYIAPLQIRMERVMAAKKLDRHKALQRIQKVEGDRARYIRHFYRADWLDLDHYDLIIDTGHFTREAAVTVTCSAAHMS